jgi:hypothetical protein
MKGLVKLTLLYLCAYSQVLLPLYVKVDHTYKLTVNIVNIKTQAKIFWILQTN